MDRPAGDAVPTINQPYTIRRRPYPSPGRPRDRAAVGRGDRRLHVGGSTQERSRLPIDSGDADGGHHGRAQRADRPDTVFSSPSASDFPFYHLWLSERGDVLDPQGTGATATRRLPLPEGTPGLPATETRFLKGDRRLVTSSPGPGRWSPTRWSRSTRADISQPVLRRPDGHEGGQMIRRGTRGRAGITLTEILISIMIMGVGLVSLATLFPLGLLAAPQRGSGCRARRFLAESAAADLATRNLLVQVVVPPPESVPGTVGAVLPATPMTPGFRTATSVHGDHPWTGRRPSANLRVPGLPVGLRPALASP